MNLMDIIISKPPLDDPPCIPPQATLLAEYVLYPIYDCVVTYFPVWWAPNKVTLFGIASTLLASFLLLTAMPVTTVFEPPYATFVPSSLILEQQQTLHSNTTHKGTIVPSPLYPTVLKPFFSSIFGSAVSMLVLCGILNTLYCFADNTDGRLARRLKKCSDIGEYLDHGLDCVTSLLSLCLTMSVLGVSFANIVVTVIPIAIVTLFSHTLHYERNIFIWGNRIISVDEAMIFFGVANWIPLVFSDFGITKVPFWLLQAVFPTAWAQWLEPLRWVDVGVLLYFVAQYQVIARILFTNFSMLFRLPTIAMVTNAAVMVGMIPFHTAHIKEHGSAGYTWGPLSYVAVWIITTATSCSSIVHILIHARCAKLPEISPLPLAGIIFVWLIYPSCPVGGMIISVLWHVLQVLVNVHTIRNNKQKLEN